MKNRIKRLIISYLILLSAVLLTACAGKRAGADDISIADPYGEGEFSYNPEAQAYNAMLEQWAKNHPEVNLDRKSIQGNYYDQELQFYGTTKSALPDIFVLRESSIEDWSRNALLGEEENRHIYLMPKDYFMIIVYDKDKWKAAGFDSFPDNWEDIMNAKDNHIAFNYKNDTTVSSVFLAPNIELFCDESWIKSVQSRERGTFFMQDDFYMALSNTKKMCSVCLKVDEYEKKSSAVDSFLNKDYSAAVISTYDMGVIKNVLKKDNPERYNRLGFAFLPLKINSEDEGTAMTTLVNQYVLVINPKVSDNPEKLARCMDLCESLTNEEYMDMYEEKEFCDTDPVWKELCELIESRNEVPGFLEGRDVEIVLGKDMRYSFDPDLTEWAVKDTYSTEEIANKFQDYYEQSRNH